MLKNNYYVILAYSFLTIYLMQFTSPSAFMFLLSLLVELVILVGIYFVISIRSKDMDKRHNGIYMVLMSIPMIMFHYFVAWQLTGVGDLTADYESNGMFAPMKNYYGAIIVMTTGLVLAYQSDVKEVFKHPESFTIVEYSVFKQLFRVWGVGMVGVLLGLGNEEGASMGHIVLAMLLARVVVEFISKKSRDSMLKIE